MLSKNLISRIINLRSSMVYYKIHKVEVVRNWRKFYFKNSLICTVWDDTKVYSVSRKQVFDREMSFIVSLYTEVLNELNYTEVSL